MAGYISEEVAAKMREAANGVRWEYRNDAGKRTVRGYDAKTGELRVEGDSMYSYSEASVQAVLDAAINTRRTNNTTVKPFDLSFKHVSAHPEFKDVLIPPKNPILDAIADEVLDEGQKAYVKEYGWSSESSNVSGARELLSKGPDKPPFISDLHGIDLLDESDDPITDEVWNTFFERDDVTYVNGVLASHYKNTIDDEGKVALFDIPRTITDPGFIDQLCFVEPPDGKTHDICMDPDFGENRSANRKEVARQTADFLYSKCKSFVRHYEAFVLESGMPTFEQCAQIAQESMKDARDSAAFFTTFKGFEKLEEMSRQKILDSAARRMIWGPGQVEAILGKILLKNVTLSSFKRFTRGNAHGVEGSNGGFTRMFQAMMNNVRDKKTFDKFLEENGLEGSWDFNEMLKHFGWRDDDLKKWDLMQFQVYMLLNLQFFIYSYNWSSKLNVDEATWLYLFIVLATIDTTVVSDLGFGPELYVRILASGLFLTASGGSKTHDTMSHSFSFRQTRIALNTWRFIKRSDWEGVDKLLFKRAYRAFKLGTPFVHFSDDFLQCMLRMGMCFGQLVNRSAFFARMFGLEFKVLPREWKSVIGEMACKKMVDLVNVSPGLRKLIRQGGDDLLKERNEKEPMNGITTEFLFEPYIKRCEQWYPLTSTVYRDDDKKGRVGLRKKGVNFLKFHFLFSEMEDVGFIVPVRDHHEMYHKLYYSKVSYKDPVQMLVKVRSYAYYTFQFPKTINTFKLIHDKIRERFFPDFKKIESDPLLRKEIPRKLGLSLEEITADFPDKTTVLAFYLPGKPKNYEEITDLREKILWSAYRSCKYDPWSLIRRKDVVVDIKGVYGVALKSMRLQQDLKRREGQGLQTLGRERKKPPSRHANR